MVGRAIRGPPCVKGAVGGADWGIVRLVEAQRKRQDEPCGKPSSLQSLRHGFAVPPPFTPRCAPETLPAHNEIAPHQSPDEGLFLNDRIHWLRSLSTVLSGASSADQAAIRPVCLRVVLSFCRPPVSVLRIYFIHRPDELYTALALKKIPHNVFSRSADAAGAPRIMSGLYFGLTPFRKSFDRDLSLCL